ncbi:MAG: DUF5057 domain-containing protein [Lachnospiraceae bacterium]|nr:DUF5057 domain-containing protein [Lachnospiraceae bacterium]
MKVTKKIAIMGILALLVALCGTSIASFVLADKSSADDISDIIVKADGDTPTTKTMIDYIIEKSNDSSEASNPYKVVEVSSSSNPSELKKMISSKVFGTQVIDGHKTITANFDQSWISYTCINVGDLKGDAAKISDAANTIRKADFIYVSNDPNSMYTKTNDIPDDVKLALTNTIADNSVPAMVDSFNMTIASITKGLYTNYATNTLDTQGISHKTYGWPETASVDLFMDPMNFTSFFTPVNGTDQAPVWEKYKIANGTNEDGTTLKTKDFTVAKILTIKLDDTSATPLTNMMKQGRPADPCTIEVVDEVGEIEYELDYEVATDADGNPMADGDGNPIYATDADGNPIPKTSTDPDVKKDADGHVYKLDDEGKLIPKKDADGNPIYATDADGRPKIPVKHNETLTDTYLFTDAWDIYTTDEKDGAYKNRFLMPDAIHFDSVNISETDNYLASYDLTKYDFVIIESSVGPKLVQADAEAKITGAMNANVHILYSQSLVVGSGSSSGINTAVNYKAVLDKVMTSTDAPKYSSVLVTSRNMVKAFSVAATPAEVDRIAEIINNGSFRGMGGSGSSSLKYTVLEIEPYYPIDTKLAAKLEPVADWDKTIATRKSIEGGDGSKDLSFRAASMRGSVKSESGFYYLRPEKSTNDCFVDNAYRTADEISYDGAMSISAMHASGDYSSIASKNVDRIEDYYAWALSRGKVASASEKTYDEVKVVHMSASELNSSRLSLADNYDAIYIGGDYSAIKKDSNWSANGKIKFYKMYSSAGEYYTDPNAYGFSGQSGVTLGNDITDEKLKELKDYADIGMPVIISNDLKTAYEGRNGNQTVFDPNSRMADLLTDISSKTNVLYGFDPSDTVRVASTDYGPAVGQVTLFNPVGSEQELKNVLSLKERPKLVVTKFPASDTDTAKVGFVEGDATTWLKDSDGAYADHTLNFSYETFSDDTTAVLFIDDDSNSRFTNEEVRATAYGKKGTLSVQLPEDYYGVVYWKVAVYSGTYTVAELSNELPKTAGASKTGILKIARGNREKMKANVLEIMPDDNPSQFGEKNWLTLFLDPECSQSKGILRGNRHVLGQGNNKFDAHIWRNNAGSYGDSDLTDTPSGALSYLNTADGSDSLSFAKIKAKLNSVGAADGYKYQGNNLGGHEYKFGIVKYKVGNLDIGGGNLHDADDWFTNWFDELRDDYEVTLNIVTISEFEKMVKEVNDAYSGLTAEQRKTKAQDYQDKYDEYNRYYTVMKDLINGNSGNVTTEDLNELKNYMNTKFGVTAPSVDAYATCVADMDSFLKTSAPATMNGVDAAMMKKEIAYETNSIIAGIDRSYYDMFSLSKVGANEGQSTFLTNFAKKYVVWRNAMMFMQFFRYETQHYLNLASGASGEFKLTDAYSCIALGAAIDYNNSDINVTACKALAKYCDDMGNMLIFNGTITAQNPDQSHNMTDYLRSKFGLDARRMVNVAPTVDTVKDQAITFNYDGNSAGITLDSNVKTAYVTLTQPVKTILHNKIVLADQNGNSQTKVTINPGTTDVNITVRKQYGNVQSITCTQSGNATGAHKVKLSIVDSQNTNGSGVYTPENASLKFSFGDYYDYNNNFAFASGNDYEFDYSEVQKDGAMTATLGTTVTATGTFDTQEINVKVQYKDGTTLTNATGEVTMSSDVNGSQTITLTNGTGSVTGLKNYVAEHTGYDFQPDPSAPSGRYRFNIQTTSSVNINPTALTPFGAQVGRDKSDTEKGNVANIFKYTCMNNGMLEYVAKNGKLCHMSTEVYNAFYKDAGATTDRALMNNEGIVVKYPFTLGNELKLSCTSGQSYAADVEDPDMTVFYSLAGGSAGSNSSYYAADPMDGANNYFVYQYKSVTYSGAGYTNVTGYWRNNDDERRLYINVIVNTARKSTLGVDLKLFDQTSTFGNSSTSATQTNKDIKTDGLNYLKEINSAGESIEFAYNATTDPTQKIKNIYAYFDLDYDPENPTAKHEYDATKDKKVFDRDIVTEDPGKNNGEHASDNQAYGKVIKTGDDIIDPPGLLIDDSYFINKNGESAAYLVVVATDTKGKKSIKHIKIKYKEEMFYLN